MLNTLSDITAYTQLSIRGTLDDQTRLVLINTAATSYVNLRGDDSLHQRLQHAVRLATSKSWINFFQVVNWALEELKELLLEDCPGQAIRG